MIAKIKVGNPTYSQNIKGEVFLTFPILKTQDWALRQTCAELENNSKELLINLEYASKQRTIKQNDLLWGLLTEEAKFLNGGRKSSDLTNSTQNLYYEALNKYGKDVLVKTLEGTEKTLKKVFRRVFIIDKFEEDGKVWLNCRCVFGSSTYNTKEMTDLIDGVLDDISNLGIETSEIRYLREEFNELQTNQKQRNIDRPAKDET